MKKQKENSQKHALKSWPRFYINKFIIKMYKHIYTFVKSVETILNHPAL